MSKAFEGQIIDTMLYNDIILLISQLKHIKAEQLLATPDLTKHNLDILDVVDIILELEKRYQVTIPDEVPAYYVGDLADYISRCLKHPPKPTS